MTTRSLPLHLPTLHSLGWAALAVMGGLACALLPPALALVALSGVALALAALVTPAAALTLLLVAAPLRTLIATESALRLPLDIGQISLVLLLGSWLIFRLADARTLPRLIPSPVYIGVGIFFAAITLSGFAAFSMAAWINEWLKWAQILILIAFCLDLASAWEWFVFSLVLSGCVNAFIGLYEFFGGSGALHLLVNERNFRAFGTFGQPNPFGGFMGLLAPLAAMAAVGWGLRAWRQWRSLQQVNRVALSAAVGYGLAFLLLSAALFASYSRGAWLGYALSLFALLIAFPRQLKHGLLLSLAVALIAALLWSSGRLPSTITTRITSAVAETFNLSDVRGVNITSENYAVVERLAHWQAALNMARANPWLGVGFGGYETAYEQYRLLNWKFALGHAHNYYLNLLAETGLIGAAAYGAMWLIVFGLAWRARRHPDALGRCLAIGLIGAFTYLGTHSLTDDLYVNNLFLHIGVLLGLLAVLYNASHRFTPYTSHLRTA